MHQLGVQAPTRVGRSHGQRMLADRNSPVQTVANLEGETVERGVYGKQGTTILFAYPGKTVVVGTLLLASKLKLMQTQSFPF